MKSHGIWRERARMWAFKVGIALAAALWLAVMAASWADAAEDDEYNFNWLDPEKKIYVLQNRKYLKANHLMLSGMVGPGISNSYRNTYAFDFRVAYHLSEAFGIETFYSFLANRENNTFEALKQAAPTTLPVVREIRSQFGILGQYVPWYAKINVFNNIIYFDWYFSGGLGSLSSALDTRRNKNDPENFVYENLFALYLGTGHRYHLSQTLHMRLDFTGAFYQAPLFGTSGDNSWYSNYTVGVGLGLKL
jgi:outer membrane beta-barrel protein